MITGKINCNKIEKARLFQGRDGQYLDIVLIPTPNGKYGDYMITQAISKEEREKGVKGPILGNAKIIGGGSSKLSTPAASTSNENDDLPF